jgi:ribosome-binding protein aMBF1 (putative translation factor)
MQACYGCGKQVKSGLTLCDECYHNNKEGARQERKEVKDSTLSRIIARRDKREREGKL